MQQLCMCERERERNAMPRMNAPYCHSGQIPLVFGENFSYVSSGFEHNKGKQASSLLAGLGTTCLHSDIVIWCGIYIEVLDFMNRIDDDWKPESMVSGLVNLYECTLFLKKSHSNDTFISIMIWAFSFHIGETRTISFPCLYNWLLLNLFPILKAFFCDMLISPGTAIYLLFPAIISP